MKNLLAFAAFAAVSTVCGAQRGPASYVLDEATGRISAFGAKDGRTCVVGIENRYFLMSRSGDVEAFEREDVVVKKLSGEGWVGYRCTNPKLPDIDIVKRYRKVNGGLRRTLAFRNRGTESKYVTPFVECRLDEAFRADAYHFGAGYLGPFKPFPKVAKPTVVEDYLQSSKGLVFVNPDGRKGCFSHYRVRIDDTVVLPWWHSTIGHYREYHDRLWYLPDGYRMGLGTFGLYADKPVAVTDQFDFFDGNLFTFFDEVFAKDPDVAAELKSIPPAPAWVGNLLMNAEDRNAWSAPWLERMLDDGEILLHCGPAIGTFSWGDYRPGFGGYSTYHGGRITEEETQAFLDRFKAISPRVHVSNYGITVSAARHVPIMREHPEWYRPRDRAGKSDSLFPECNDNWQTMFCVPEAREWIAKMFCDVADRYGLDTIYLDENQMTNTIDWEKDRVTRDDDTVRFWKRLVAEKTRRGKAYFANGSGIPYVDVNYIEECRGTLKPECWRDGAGVLLGVAMMNRMRPSGRVVPLYWSPGNDYANRILTLGWVPRPQGRSFDEVPVIRAVWQGGPMFPCDVRYTPDWKADPATTVESYACRREGTGDVVLSVINRGASAADIPLKVDLGSLGFAKGRRINVFRQHHDVRRAGTCKEEILSDAEIKANWTRGVLRGARVSDPELVYSGAAHGWAVLPVAGLESGGLEQFVFAEGPLGLFSENGQPLNAFFTSQRQARIAGRRVTVGRTAEVLLLDRERDFADITANGKAAAVRTVKVGSLTGKLVALGAGEWTLDWRETPRGRASAAELPKASDRPRTALLPFPRKWIPERREEKHFTLMAPDGGLRMLGKGVFASAMDPGNRMQEETGLPYAAARADERTFTLTAGTTRREGEIEGMANFAGFELSGAKTLNLRFSFDASNSVPYIAYTGHAAPWAFEHNPSIFFVGLMVDYRVGGKYVKRVALSLGRKQAEFALETPPYGARRRPDDYLSLGEWLDDPAPREFALDLAKYAPAGWDGTAWVSLGTSAIQANRTFRLEFLDFLKKPFPGIYDPPDPPPPDRTKALAEMAKLTPAVAEVRKTPGGAQLVVDGKVSNACFYMGEYDFRIAGEFGADLVVAGEAAGIDGVEDELLRIHHANPRARVLVAVDLSPDAAFFAAHPEEIFVNDRGERGRVWTSVCDTSGKPLHAQYDFTGFGNAPLKDGETWAFSYGGPAWRAFAEEKLTRFVRRLKDSPAGNIVVGFHLLGGMDGQFVQWEYRPHHGHFDYSEGNRRALGEYLKGIYGSEAALREAWGDGKVTFATAANPSVAEFGSVPFFDDKPGKGRRLADCRRFVSSGLARNLNAMARRAKDEWGRPSVVELWWTTAIWPQPSRLALDELIAGRAVDIVKTVSWYAPERSIGGIGGSGNNLGESLSRRGVLYVQEMDHRTRRSGKVDNPWWTDEKVGMPPDDAGYELQITRDAASVIAAGGKGLCFYDMLGSWYHEKEASASIRKVVAIQSFVTAHAGEYERPSTLILMDEQARLLREACVNEQPSVCWRTSGLTPSIRLTSDLADPSFPSYRLCLLWNAVGLTRAQADVLRSRVASGMTLVAVGRTGICSRDFASEDEALEALGPGVRRIADAKSVTDAKLNELARQAGARVHSEPGNVTYIGNGVACVHRIAGPVRVDFGREVTPVDPQTGKTSAPVRQWCPDIPVNGLAVMTYLP